MNVAAQSFRTNPELDTVEVISNLGVGEALVSVLGDKGIPTQVERVLICPPRSRIGPADEETRQAQLTSDPLLRRYKEAYDPHSAHEEIEARLQRIQQIQANEKASEPATSRSTGRTRETASEAMLKSLARSIGSGLGRQLIRGVLGSLLK